MYLKQTRRHWIAITGIAASVAALCSSHTALAQATDGRVRLGIEAVFLGLKGTGYGEEDDDDDEARGEFVAGFGVSDVAFNAGYGFNDVFTLGARFRTGGSSFAVVLDGDEQPVESEGLFSLWPYAEFNLSDPQGLQTFIGPELGLDIYGWERKVEDGFDPKESLVLVGLGGLFGMRTFVGDRGAIEGALHVRLAGGRYKSEFARGQERKDPAGRLEIMLTIGGALWLGGKPTYVPIAEATPAEPPPSTWQYTPPPGPQSAPPPPAAAPAPATAPPAPQTAPPAAAPAPTQPAAPAPTQPAAPDAAPTAPGTVDAAPAPATPATPSAAPPSAAPATAAPAAPATAP